MKIRGNSSYRIFQIILVLIILLFLIFVGIKSKISGLVSNDQVIVSAKLEPSYPIARGSLVIVEIKIYQPASVGDRDITLSYYFVENNVKQKVRSQTVALDTYLSTISKLEIPESIKGNSINLEIEVSDSETQELLGATSQTIILYDRWSVAFSKHLLAFMAIALVITAIILLIILFFKCRKMMKNQVMSSRSAKVRLK